MGCCDHGCMHDHDCQSMVAGVFLDGTYTVDGYTITVQQVTVDNRNGYKITIGKGEEVQEMTILDGVVPDLTEFNLLLGQMREALGACNDAEGLREEAEAARKAAEEARDQAENGTGDPDQDKKEYRAGLYELMMELYDKYVPDLEKWWREAKQAAETAAEKAQEARDIAAGDFAALIMYKDGDTIQFVEEEFPTDTNYRVSTMYRSPSMNAGGYVTSSAKSIHIKFPVAKLLTNITSIECTELTASIVNSGGYAMQSGVTTGGRNYLPYIRMITVDKVQNCIHVIIERAKAWILNNNEPVTCRCSSVSFTLHAEGSSEGSDEA